MNEWMNEWMNDVCSVQYVVSLLFAAIGYFIITLIVFYNVLLMFVSYFVYSAFVFRFSHCV